MIAASDAAAMAADVARPERRLWPAEWLASIPMSVMCPFDDSGHCFRRKVFASHFAVPFDGPEERTFGNNFWLHRPPN
jgi:hypothetical protein